MILGFFLLTTFAGAVPVTLNWKGNNPPASVDYVVQEKLSDGSWGDVISTKLTSVTLELVPAVYLFRVVARDLFWGTSGKQSNPTNVVATPDPNPQAPTVLTKQIGA
jgi:hypothetical protein